MVHLLGPSGYDLLRTFRIEPLALFRFLGLVEAGYHVSNPYHNAVHAADVTQAMHCFLREGAILQHLTPIEVINPKESVANPQKNSEVILNIPSSYIYLDGQNAHSFIILCTYY